MPVTVKRWTAARCRSCTGLLGGSRWRDLAMFWRIYCGFWRNLAAHLENVQAEKNRRGAGFF
jgi:hypothetical protein